MKPNRSGDRSVVGAGMTVTGQILSASTGLLEIRGRVSGEIDHRGPLLIAREGICASNIRAQSVQVWGEVRGDLEVADLLELMPTARVVGNVVCRRLRIHPGALFQGTTRMEVRDDDSGSKPDEPAGLVELLPAPEESAEPVALLPAPQGRMVLEPEPERRFEFPSFFGGFTPAPSRR